MHHEQLEFAMDTRREWEDAIKRLGDHVRAVEAARLASIKASVDMALKRENFGGDAEASQIGRR